MPARAAISLAAIALLVGTACSHAVPTRCPGAFTPSRMSDPQLRTHGIGDIPESAATERAAVERVLGLRREWILKNYPGAVSVEVGRGWGVSYTRDKYGTITYHHHPDFMLVTTMEEQAACPDPHLGTRMILDRTGLRFPVRFSYLAQAKSAS